MKTVVFVLLVIVGLSSLTAIGQDDDPKMKKLIEIILRLEKANEIPVIFAPNQAILSPPAHASLKKQAGIILTMPADTVIDIESHAYGTNDETAKWRQKDISSVGKTSFETKVPSHGVVLLRVTTL